MQLYAWIYWRWTVMLRYNSRLHHLVPPFFSLAVYSDHLLDDSIFGVFHFPPTQYYNSETNRIYPFCKTNILRSNAVTEKILSENIAK